MKLVLGSFTFDVNEVWFSPSFRVTYGQTGRKQFIDHRWTIHDVIFGTSLDNLKSKTQAREAAAKNISGDVVFSEDDGTETAHKIIFGNCISGIQVDTVAYPGGLTGLGGRAFGSGSEMADSTTNFRYLVTTITAREVVTDYPIVYYWQSFQYSGGGTQFVVQGAFNGLPRRFNTMQNAPCWAVQRGKALSVTGTPTSANTLISTSAVDPEKSWIKAITPEIIGPNGEALYGAEWLYYFKDPLPMPAIPPNTP